MSAGASEDNEQRSPSDEQGARGFTDGASRDGVLQFVSDLCEQMAIRADAFDAEWHLRFAEGWP
jgi:hypothetical protein